MLRSNRLALFVFSLACTWGCSQKPSDVPPLAKVQGTITLDGVPLEGAMVIFEPQETGAASTGATDEQGHYSLIYSAAQNGAVPGDHVVRISKLTMEMGEETLPTVYNEKSTLKSVVSMGDNTIDFDLESRPTPKKR